MKSEKPFNPSLDSQMRRRIFWWSVTLMLVSSATVTLGRHQDGATTPTQSQSGVAQSNDQIITPIPFGELNGDDVYNASGVVPLADSRFLFCDNNSNDALFELDLDAEGQRKGPLIRR